uniref:Globin CTT-W n=1 Tax=Chironomus thummi piger TaxID=7156 RepID=GLBW_CHITP|nr:RecName: Full=Globin CTT-W; AltName: Full=HBW; Flags: Precursor [Chironomus piger]CAA39719.1 Ctp HbW [Chironomus thummi]
MKFLVILTLCIAGAIAHCDKAPFIKASWNQVKHNEVDILYTVFKAYPEIQDRFPQFAGKDLEAIKETAEFAVHSTRIVSFMSEIVSLVGNPAVQSSIDLLLVKMANDHKARGVTKELFEKFNIAFMGYLKSHTTWDEKTENAWKVVGDEHHAIVYSILE